MQLHSNSKMSIFDDYEEIDFSDDSTKNSEKNLPSRPNHILSPKTILISRLSKLKSNPDTFDYENLLNQVKRPVKFSKNSSPVVERMMFDHQLSLNKKRFMIQEKEYEDIKSCTFTPKILNPQKKRTFNDFYNQQKLFLCTKQEKIAKLKLNLKIETEANQIKTQKRFEISPGSRKILETKSKTEFLITNKVPLSERSYRIKGKPPLPYN
jgi:hypothetical protein